MAAPQIVSNIDPGNFLTDGTYIDLIPAQSASPQGPQTGLVAVVGTATDGPVGQAAPFADAASLFAEFGTGTVLPHSLVREALSAMPECVSFLGVRATDGTDIAATIALKDTTAPTAVTLITLTRKNTGSNANNASAKFDLVSGTLAAAPIYRLTIQYPNQPAEIYNNIVGSVSGGAFAAATFQANVLAAVNVGTAQSGPSPRWTATAGAGTNSPQIATYFQAIGGTDGASGVVTAQLVGTDGDTGRLGLYALRGLVSGAQVILAALTDPTAGSTLIAFGQQENCVAHLAFPSLTSTVTEISTRASNALSNPSLVLDSDWDYVNDSVSGQLLLVSPMGKIAGIIAGTPAYLYPGNQPVSGAAGVIATDRITNGLNGVAAGEAGERQSNGILYLSFMPRNKNGPMLGLPHGMASDGVTRICDVRMLKQIADQLQGILGAIIGQPMSGASGAQFGQPAFGDAQDAVESYLNGLLNGSPQQIAAYTFLLSSSMNTPTSVQKGFLIPNVLVQTLSAAQFIVAALQVGSTVQVSVAQPNA